jgi:integrase
VYLPVFSLLVEYVEKITEKKRDLAGGELRSSYQFYMTLAYHLKKFSGDKTIFKHIDKKYCIDFIEYMKTAKSKLNDRPLDEATQRQYIKRLSSVLNIAIADEIIVSNLLLQIKPKELPKNRSREVCYLSIDEVRKLIDTPCYYSDIRNAFSFSCFTGLWFSDIKALTWGKLKKDSNENTFISYTQKKTQKWGNLPMAKRKDVLAERGTALDSDLVFLVRSGGYENSIIKTWAIAVGIEKTVSFHVDRHTAETLLLSLEVPIETVSKILGHADIKTTQIYAKVIDKSKQDAIDKLDGLTG